MATLGPSSIGKCSRVRTEHGQPKLANSNRAFQEINVHSTHTQLTLNSHTNTHSRNHKSDIGVPDNTGLLSAAAADTEKCRTF